MKLYLPVTIAMLALLAKGDVTAQSSSIPPCRAQYILDLPDTSCNSLIVAGRALETDEEWLPCYDTFRVYLESCPLQEGSYSFFADIQGAVSQWTDGGAGRWPDFLIWLKKVLYLNPDTMWYCADVLDMLSAIQTNDFELDKATEMAAVQYILDNNRCQGFAHWQNYYNSASQWRHAYWLDSIESRFSPQNYPLTWQDSINADTLAHPYDSTIPSLYAVDLQILLGPQYAAVQENQATSSQALLTAQLLENPMKDEIDIAFEMGRTALVSMQLSDVLGRNIPIANAKYQLEQPGQHNAAIPAPNLPPGTYYLRITTDVGDAITLKVVKE